VIEKSASWRGYVDEYGRIASSIKPPKALTSASEALANLGRAARLRTKHFLPGSMRSPSSTWVTQASGKRLRLIGGVGGGREQAQWAGAGKGPGSYYTISKSLREARQRGDVYVYNNLKKLRDRLFTTSSAHEHKIPHGL
jgi:hypothetical protein